jgi:transposase
MSHPSLMTHPTNGKSPSSTPVEESPPSAVESEVLPRAKRRYFSAEYKRRILREADQCIHPGQVGALLRREGLYSSHLTSWRRQREKGNLGTQKRGPTPADPTVKEVERLRRENDRLRKRLEKAETIISVQKKLSDLLGLTSDAPPKDAAPPIGIQHHR